MTEDKGCIETKGPLPADVLIEANTVDRKIAIDKTDFFMLRCNILLFSWFVFLMTQSKEAVKGIAIF
jgi:hypothetical protein